MNQADTYIAQGPTRITHMGAHLTLDQAIAFAGGRVEFDAQETFNNFHIEADCYHAECTMALVEEIARTGREDAESICLERERRDDAFYAEADAACTRWEDSQR